MNDGRSGAAVTADTRSFFERLRRLHFGPGKPDAQENLLDILELVAVHVGLKPSHLQGQGQCDPSTLAEVETLAIDVGLLTRRTRGLPDWKHRAYGGDAEFYARTRAAQGEDHELLWVYRDAAVAARIDQVLSGVIGVGAVLGYPPCCEQAHSEQGLMLLEAMERGYREQYGAKTTDDLVRLAREDRPVSVGIDPGARLRRTAEAYPFVQFTACDACLRKRGSAAARVNNALRILARDLDPSFVRTITR